MVQWVKLLLGMSTSHIKVLAGSSPSCFASNQFFVQYAWERQRMMAQALGSLSPLLETWMASGFGLA